MHSKPLGSQPQPMASQSSVSKHRMKRKHNDMERIPLPLPETSSHHDKYKNTRSKQKKHCQLQKLMAINQIFQKVRKTLMSACMQNVSTSLFQSPGRIISSSMERMALSFNVRLHSQPFIQGCFANPFRPKSNLCCLKTDPKYQMEQTSS